MVNSRNNRNSEISNSRGRRRKDVRFPTAPIKATLPQDYANTLGAIKRRIQETRLRVVLSGNSEMVMLYWDIGRIIIDRQEQSGWGARVIDRLSADLREAFPDTKGFSPRNLKYMRTFSSAWPKRKFVQEALAQIPWYHHIALLEKLDRPAERLWYAREAVKNGWSHNILVLQIQNHFKERHGKADTNFKATLPPPDSDMAAQIFKDPYLFDFLGTADLRREAEVEQALVDHIQSFLLELGTGFAFIGRQVHLEFVNQDYYLDLLFYHLKLRCYVVIELKSVPFDPAFVGRLNMYLSAVDDALRHPDDKPTIGLLLCRSKEKVVVEYALRDLKKPIGVAGWKTKLVDKLPWNYHGSLPTVEEIEAELAGPVSLKPKQKNKKDKGRRHQ